MVGTKSVKLMRSRSMVFSTASGSKPLSMCTVPPRIGEAAIFAVGAQSALGFSGGAAGVVQRRDVVGDGKAARCRAAGLADRGQKIGAIAGAAEREHGLQAGRLETGRLETGRLGRDVAAAIVE